MVQCGHKFARVTTAELSWHVQNCDLIKHYFSNKSNMNFYKNWIFFLKNPFQNGPQALHSLFTQPWDVVLMKSPKMLRPVCFHVWSGLSHIIQLQRWNRNHTELIKDTPYLTPYLIGQVPVPLTRFDRIRTSIKIWSASASLKCAKLITINFWICRNSVTKYIMNKSVQSFIEFQIQLKYR